MEVRNCKGCGRLYNYIGGSYKNLCPNCIGDMEEKFQEVKKYIEDNKLATLTDISQDCEVKIEQLERWVKEERLFFSEDSPIGIACEGCGVTIKSGRFCPACKNTMTNQLNSMYSAPSSFQSKKDDRESAKMRFLEK